MRRRRRAAGTRCSIRARRGRTSAGRRRGSPRWPRRCASGTGCCRSCLWGPGEESLARRGRRAAAGAAILSPRTSIADLVALARGAAVMVSGDTGPDAPRRGGRHADRRHLRADAAGAQRTVVARRRDRVARRRLPVPSSAALPARDDVPARHSGGRGRHAASSAVWRRAGVADAGPKPSPARGLIARLARLRVRARVRVRRARALAGARRRARRSPRAWRWRSSARRFASGPPVTSTSRAR